MYWLYPKAFQKFPGGASVARPPVRPMNPPGHGLPALRAPEAVVAAAGSPPTTPPRRSANDLSPTTAHVTQNRKASVSLPPTGSSTDGLIATDPRQPQTSPV